MIVLLFLAAILFLTGLDARISYLRWKHGVRDLNPLLQWLINTIGPKSALAALLMSNLFLMVAAYRYPLLLATILGAKLALASFQLRSLNG
jgi:hypothetical protein